MSTTASRSDLATWICALGPRAVRRRAVRLRTIGLSLLWLCAACPAPACAQTYEARARAAQHFDRGIALFNEGRHDAALAELARAYELAPAHQVLYNLARVHAALGHAVEAARSYARYLEEAPPSVGERRRREVEEALAEQRSRVGQLDVVVDRPGATIAIDGVDVASAPLDAPLELSAGTHTLEVRAPAHEAQRRAVVIAGETLTRVEVALREEVVPRGTLRVRSDLPEVTITVDGEPVGLTPLRSTIPLRAGPHRVVASREGYRTDRRDVIIEEGAEVELRFDLRRAPEAEADSLGRIRLRLPDAPSLVRVDGEPMLGHDLELPIGAHHVVIEVTDRRPYEGTVRVPRTRTIVIRPSLSWTLDARREQIEAAEEQRRAGVGLAVAGGATLLAAVAVLSWNEAEIAATDARVVEVNEALGDDMCTMGFPAACAQLEAEGLELARRQDEQNVLRGVSVAGLLLGATLAGPGLALWLTAPSEEEIDADARARLRLRPLGASLDVTF